MTGMKSVGDMRGVIKKFQFMLEFFYFVFAGFFKYMTNILLQILNFKSKTLVK
jgi:hypothetical protein